MKFELSDLEDIKRSILALLQNSYNEGWADGNSTIPRYDKPDPLEKLFPEKYGEKEVKYFIDWHLFKIDSEEMERLQDLEAE